MKTNLKLGVLTLMVICTSATYIKSDDCNKLAQGNQCPGCDIRCSLSHQSFAPKRDALGHLISPVANFEGASFIGSDAKHPLSLAGTDFAYAHLANANFSNTFLSNTNFSGADLQGAHFTDALFYSDVNLNYANLRGLTVKNTQVQTSFSSHVTVNNADELLEHLPLKRGTRWPTGWCPDHRCFTEPNKATVILNKIDNQSDTDYVIATSDAPLTELINELESSTITGSSLLTTWLQVYLRNPEDPDPIATIKLSKTDHMASITGTYQLRFHGESIGDKPLVAKAKTVNEFVVNRYTTFPDVSSDIGPTGTDNQTIILFPKNLAEACRHVILLGRWKDQGVGTNIFVAYTYATYHGLNRCVSTMTKDTMATAAPLKLNPSTSPLNVGKGGYLALVIGANKIPTSLIATAA